jgi:hypothetical protein
VPAVAKARAVSWSWGRPCRPTVPKADVMLPIANVVEEEGTFTNLRGRVQRFLQAKATQGMARPSWYVLSDLLGAMGEKAEYFTASDGLRRACRGEPAFAGLSYDTLGLRGCPSSTRPPSRRPPDERLPRDGPHCCRRRLIRRLLRTSGPGSSPRRSSCWSSSRCTW